MRFNFGWISLLLTAALLLGAQIAYAAFAYNNVTGPTIVQNNGNGTWNVRWTLNVTTLNGNDNNVCASTSTGQSATCTGTAPGTFTCNVTNVPNNASVSWDISSYTGSCGSGSKRTQGPTGTISPLAVELADFSAVQQQTAIVVSWETTSELNHRGFNVWRSDSPDAPTLRLNATLIAPQAPGSAAGHLYTWQDSTDLVAGHTYYYWLEALETGGAVEQYGPVAVDYRVPTAVTLHATATPQPAALLIALAFGVILATLSVIGTNRARTSFDGRS